MPALAKAASNEAMNWPARSRTRNRKSAARSPRSTSRLRACWVVHGPSGWVLVPRMDVAGGDLGHEEHIDPSESDRAVHGEEVARQHGGRLSAQELPPRRVGVPARRRRYPQAL